MPPGGAASPARRRATYAPSRGAGADRKSTRLNSSHSQISYAVFCLKKKNRRDGSCVEEPEIDAVMRPQVRNRSYRLPRFMSTIGSPFIRFALLLAVLASQIFCERGE